MGDAPEGSGRDEAGQPRPPILEHLGSLADVCADCGGPRAGLDEGASSAPGVPPRPGVGRRTGCALEERLGEMRIGVNEGVMLEGIADASGVDLDTVRTAHMFLR